MFHRRDSLNVFGTFDIHQKNVTLFLIISHFQGGKNCKVLLRSYECTLFAIFSSYQLLERG